MAALQKNVVGNQLLALGMEDSCEPLQQFTDIRRWLKGRSPWSGKTLWSRAASNDILGLHKAAATAAQKVEKSALLIRTPEIAFVQHQQQSLTEIGDGTDHCEFRLT